MIQSTNFPLSTYCVEPYGGWEEISKKVKMLGLDGLEFIADPDNLPDDIPLSLAKGYHMTFYVDWLDFCVRMMQRSCTNMAPGRQ